MAPSKIAKYFLIFPTGREVYAWEIRDTRNGARPISKHKFLGFATLEAERLNRVAQEKESNVICITDGQHCAQEHCQLGAGHLGWHSTPAQASPVSAEKGQMSESQLSDTFIRDQQDAYNRGCDFGNANF